MEMMMVSRLALATMALLLGSVQGFVAGGPRGRGRDEARARSDRAAARRLEAAARRGTRLEQARGGQPQSPIVAAEVLREALQHELSFRQLPRVPFSFAIFFCCKPLGQL